MKVRYKHFNFTLFIAILEKKMRLKKIHINGDNTQM